MPLYVAILTLAAIFVAFVVVPLGGLWIGHNIDKILGIRR